MAKSIFEPSSLGHWASQGGSQLLVAKQDFLEDKIISLELNLDPGPCSANTLIFPKGSKSLGEFPVVEV